MHLPHLTSVWRRRIKRSPAGAIERRRRRRRRLACTCGRAAVEEVCVRGRAAVEEAGSNDVDGSGGDRQNRESAIGT
jgi:hypothetical protein